MEPTQVVLHPTDFSRSSDHAFDIACTLARTGPARLIVLHVAEPGAVVAGDAAETPTALSWEEEIQHRLNVLREKAKPLPIELRQAQGNATDEIVRAVHDLRAGTIVMGTHGRSGLKRLMMGSIAQAVMQAAPCQVIIVKMPVKDHGA